MSAPPLESSFFYRMATSLNKAWADWFVSLGSAWDSFTSTIASLGTMATQNANNVAITGGSVAGITDVAVADGGTGASTAATARSNLGAAGLADANVFTQQNTFSAGGIVLPTGTFTPTLVSSGGGAPTYSVQAGTYTVIGNRVSFNAVVIISAYGTLAAGNLTIAGLPFTSESSSSNPNICAASCDALDAAATTEIVAVIPGGSSSITLYRYAAGTRSALTKALTTASASFRVTGIYQV